MKSLTTTTIVTLLLIFGLTSCSQEKVSEGVYAPNQELVSSSKEELSKTIANAMELDHENTAIQSIEFQEVEKGFLAEVELSTFDDHFTVYYMSSEIQENLEVDSSIELVQGSGSSKLAPGLVAWCSCGITTTPSSACRVSVTYNPNGSTTGTCYQEGTCATACVYHQQ